MPRPDGACSCYLVQTGRAAVLFDIGSGAASKLRRAIEYGRLDAIVISHMHADHFFDLVPLRYGLKYGETSSPGRLPLWLPPGGRRALEALRGAVSVDAPPDFFESAFAIEEYDPGAGLQVNDVRLRFCRTRHYVEAYAMRAECGDASLTYSADTAPCDGVVELARQASLFLCEAALGLGAEEGERGHSSAEEAGEMARRADAKRLVLTHYPDGDAGALVDCAKRRFASLVSAAEDGMEIAL
ncbi:MAG: MBL fold metallo-hydrolase [Candidatus Cybelea sp.]